MNLSETPGQTDDAKGESQGFQQPRQTVCQSGRPVQPKQLLDSIPDIRNRISGQRGRPGRSDGAGPFRPSPDIGNHVEDTEKQDKDSQAEERPGGRGLNLRDDPEPMADQAQQPESQRQ